MITNKMTFEEIHKQLSFDVKEFEKSNTFKEILNKYRREIKRSKKTEFFFNVKSFTSKKFNNEWFMITNAERCNKDYYLDISYYTFRYLERGGMICYCICMGESKEKEPTLFVIPQHFWERYRERVSHTEAHTIKGFDLIHFFFDNNGITSVQYNKERGEKEVIGICEDGLCLGEIVSTIYPIINFKTYISNTEMHDNQKSIHERGLKVNDIEIEAMKRFGLSKEEFYQIVTKYLNTKNNETTSIVE